jgi:hypothetical protein
MLFRVMGQLLPLGRKSYKELKKKKERKRLGEIVNELHAYSYEVFKTTKRDIRV